MSDIDVGEGWRRLKPGEVIQEGDQWLANSYANIWYDTESVGDKVRESDPLLYRRRRSPEVAALSDGLSSLAARVEKIEARMSEAFTKNAIIRESESDGGAVNPAADASGGDACLLREKPVPPAAVTPPREAAPDSRAAVNADGLRTERVTNAIDLDDHEEAFAELERERPEMGDDGRQWANAALEAGRYAITRLTAERDAVIRERDEARAECKMLLAERDEATGRCKMMLARVAELGAAPDANVGGEQEPVAWGVLNELGKRIAVIDEEPSDGWVGCTFVPLYSAPQPPRGWLTKEERGAVERVRDHLLETSQGEFGDIVSLDALLARSIPPRVRRPRGDSDLRTVRRDNDWIAAIREAGVEVE